MQIRRRDLSALLPALLLPGALKLDALAADIPTLESGGFPFDKLEPKTSATGSIGRAVFKGKLATGGIRGSSRNNFAAGSDASSAASACAFRNVVDARGRR